MPFHAKVPWLDVPAARSVPPTVAQVLHEHVVHRTP
jgi:hypothetical protein